MPNKKKYSQKNEKKKKLFISEAIVNIHSTYNNTIVTVSSLEGNVVAWSSSGQHGFKGTKKSTAHAAKVVVEHVMNEKLKNTGLKKISIKIKGFGPGKISCLKNLQQMDYEIKSIQNVTPIPFNGCKLRKKERMKK